MSWRDAMRPLRSRPFRYLVLGRTTDHLANAIAMIALAFAVLDLGGSASELGLVLACRSVPLVVLILLGGVIADRLPRSLVLVVANVVAAATQGLVALLLVTGTAEIWTVAAIEAVNGIASAFLYPAASGLTPQTVAADQLQPANALLRLGSNLSLTTGSAVGGVLVAATGPATAFAVDAALYAAAAILLARMRLPRSDRVATQNVVADLRDGWLEFRSRTWLWVIVLTFSFVNAAQAAGITTLGPVVADDTIGRAAWGFVLAAMTVGMLLGGVVALRAQWPRPLFAGCVGVLLFAPVFLVLGTQPRVVPLIGAALLAGVGLEVFSVAWDVAMQSNVPEDKLSRVYAYDWFGSLVFIPLGQTLAGPLAGAFGVRDTIVGCGVVVILGGAAALSVPSVRRLQPVSARPGTAVQE